MNVWAPRADRVRLRRPDRPDLDLQPDPAREGWWNVRTDLEDGDPYGFVLGESEHILPDPRARRLPGGVHRPSAYVDFSAFRWRESGWAGRELAGGVIYELHIGTFTPTGTLDAAIARLGHLVELGVTHVELLPVNSFNGIRNWGYDGVAWYAVHEAYGGPAAYQRFVDAAHAAGLAVIQDVVYNHLGPSGNVLPEFGPYLREGERNTWGASINLDEDAVRAYIIENALMWLRDYRVDGLRLDAVHALSDSRPVHILAEISAAVDALAAERGIPLSLIAESDLNDPVMITPRNRGGYGMTAQWSDDWHHAVHVALTGEIDGYYADFADPWALPKVWTEGFYHDGTHSSFRGHDHGHPIPCEVPASRLVTFAQDHDQIGNRAAGDRLSQTLSFRRLAVAAVLTLSTPGTPMLFMGEEWGASTPWPFFTSHPEPELGEATAKGRLAEFARMGWDTTVVPDPQDPDTFARAKLDWTESTRGEHADLLRLYRDLIALRQNTPELTDTSFAALTAAVIDDPDPRHRAFRLGRGELDVLVNLGRTERRFDNVALVLVCTDPVARHDRGSIVLAPDSAAVVRRAILGERV